MNFEEVAIGDDFQLTISDDLPQYRGQIRVHVRSLRGPPRGSFLGFPSPFDRPFLLYRDAPQVRSYDAASPNPPKKIAGTYGRTDDRMINGDGGGDGGGGGARLSFA